MRIKILYKHHSFICYQVEYKHRYKKQVEIFKEIALRRILRITYEIIQSNPLCCTNSISKKYKIKRC